MPTNGSVPWSLKHKTYMKMVLPECGLRARTAVPTLWMPLCTPTEDREQKVSTEAGKTVSQLTLNCTRCLLTSVDELAALH